MKKNETSKSIGKIIKDNIVLLLFLLFLCWISNIVVDQYDEYCWNINVFNILRVIIFILAFVIYNFKKIRIVSIPLIVISVLLIIANDVYYNNYSITVEVPRYLHEKYDMDYDDIEITYARKSWHDMFGGNPRGAKVVYKKTEFEVNYYSGEWKDNYTESKYKR
jgi:hypothetical protein